MIVSKNKYPDSIKDAALSLSIYFGLTYKEGLKEICKCVKKFGSEYPSKEEENE